jgi:radical SAM superfamily enzyme YgiQ (UPF0313 family)
VLDDARHGRLARAYRNGEHEFDLTDTPMPAFELLDMDRYNRITVQTTRGCPHVCEFCASSILLTRKYKAKPIDRVLAEVDRVRELWRRPFIELADDNSLIDKAYWTELLPQLADRKIKWFTETDVSVGTDVELLELLRQSGCVEVLVGLESPVEDGLAGIELRADWKRKRLPDYKQVVRNIQSAGIRVNGCFILGLDGHCPDVFDEVYRFVEELELYDVQITLPTPFPGTPLYERLQREGRLLEDRPWRKCTLFDVTFQPTHMTPEELAAGFRDLAVRLYAEDFTLWRRDVFRRKYLRGTGSRTRRPS